jgi:hypothetical protein
MQLTGNKSQDGRFAHAAGAHDGHDTAARNIHADIIQYDFVITLKRHVF